MQRSILVPAVLAAMLSACGGTTSGGPPVAPTPPPPAPPPPPPAGPTYGSFPLTASATLDGASATITYRERGIVKERPLGGFTHLPEPGADSNGLLIYDPASNTYQVRGPVFTQAERQASCWMQASVCYQRQQTGADGVERTDFAAIHESGTATSAPVRLTYSSFVAFGRVSIDLAGDSRTSEIGFGVTGFRTQPSDMPRTGSGSYRTFVHGQIVTGAHEARPVLGESTFTADFASGAIQTSLDLRYLNGGAGIDVLSGAGTIASGSNRFSGTLSGTSYVGDFRGGFFGPQAQEMGYSFSLGERNGTGQIVGVTLGSR